MADFSIGEVARRAGIATSTIRYYEQIGLLPAPARANGRRRYDAGILQTLAVVRLAQQMGCSLPEIQALLYGFPEATPPAERWQAIASEKVAQLDALIARAQAMKALVERTGDCRCDTLSQCADGAEGP